MSNIGAGKSVLLTTDGIPGEDPKDFHVGEVAFTSSVPIILTASVFILIREVKRL